MPSIVSPCRLDMMQRAIFGVLSEACAPAQVAWGYGEQTFESFPSEFISLQLTGPTAGLRQHRQGRALTPIASVVARVATTSELVRLVITVNGVEYFEDPQPGDTLSTIRDRFLAQLQTFEGAHLTLSADGADGIRLTANFPGALYSLQLGQGWTFDGLAPSGTCVLLTEATREYSLNVGCFSKGREPRNGAWDLSARALAAFEAEDLGYELDRVGVGLRARGPSVDLSAIAGAHWESRVAFPIDLYQRSRFVREVGEISGAEILLTYTDTAGNTVATNTATVP